VVERVVLKWNHKAKPPGELWSCYVSNVSITGDVAVTVSGLDNFGELVLFNSDGKIAWSKHYGDKISDPQLSDDGNMIAVQVGNVGERVGTLMAYDKRGKLLWTYNTRGKATISDYRLSRDGKYAAVSVFEEGLFGIKGHFILLRDGNVEWVKSGRGVAGEIAISPNNAYIVTTLYDRGKDSTHVTLYTIDGAELWTTTVEGCPISADVSDNGEVLLTIWNLEVLRVVKLFFIANGRVLWVKDDCSRAQFTRSGDRIIATRGSRDLGFSVEVFDREGELLWKYRDMYSFAVSDNYYVLGNEEEVVLVSTKGEILQRIKISELEEVETKEIKVKISPDGRYFTVGIKGNSEGEEMCYFYFYENRDHLIRDVKEKLLREIDELIKR